MNKFFTSLITIIVFLILIAGCNLSKQSPNFVEVDGAAFTINGQEYTFVGTNFWYGAYLGQEGENGNRDRLRNELDILKEHGITNLRILGASEESIFENSLEPVFINKDGSYNEDLLIGLDYLLSEMGKRDMKAVVFLNNFWEWSGGMSMYQSWYSDKAAIDPSGGEWTAFMRFSAEFYSNEEANSLYRDYIKTLIQRENTITGLKYSEDQSIMAWQLANEPRPGQGEESMSNVPAYVEWIDSTAAFIKSLDQNHLVSTGSEGDFGSLNSMDVYVDAHDTPNIDYLTFHMWAKNWMWIDPSNMEGTIDSAVINATDYIDRHVEIADSLNKPIVMEEFGFPRDDESYAPNSPVTFRDEYYKMVFSKVEQYDAFAGSNFWSWGGVGEALNQDYWWQPGDPFTGDPPQEPQGLNSVFATDSTTLEIIKEHAERL